MRHVAGFVSMACLALCAGAGLALRAQPTRRSAEQQPWSASTRRSISTSAGISPGREVEDYGSWRCTGHDGIAVHVTRRRSAHLYQLRPERGEGTGRAADARVVQQRGQDHRMADRAPAERQAACLRHHPALEYDRHRTTTTSKSRGQVLVVTRLGPGGVCHVGYVDGRANPNANELAARARRRTRPRVQVRQGQAVMLGDKGPGFQRAL